MVKLSKLVSSWPGVWLRTKGISPNADRDLSDKLASEVISKIRNNRDNLPSITAVFRVKNGAHTITPAIASVSLLVKEVIVVDNQSDDNTVDVVENLRGWLACRGVNLRIERYEQDLCRAGSEYQEQLREFPAGSLARYYNYAFSLVQTEYCMKFDAHYFLIPSQVATLQKKISLNLDSVALNIRDIFGRNHGFEPLIFRNNGTYEFVDSKNFEILVRKDRRRASFLAKLRRIVWMPSVLHIKRILY